MKNKLITVTLAAALFIITTNDTTFAGALKPLTGSGNGLGVVKKMKPLLVYQLRIVKRTYLVPMPL